VLALITGDGHRLDEYDLSSLSTLQTGAEVCNVRVVNEWLRRLPLRFINSYGPTEATVGCISFLKPEPGPLLENDCPIGTPHTGTRIELLDADGAFLTRPGVEGEIVIAGPQLMSGYWRRPSENERVFVVIDGERFYRTGDFATRSASGQYRIVGRRDDEVKFNGHRIHLNEVSTCLCSHACTESALAGIIEVEASQREIVAIVATTELPTLALARELDTHVSSRLPAAMRPTRWAFMHVLPRLPSGKADREECLRRLSLAVRASDARYYVQVETALSPLPRAA
jgi:acyl-coenzyme A synthetase/AMP-(fatty) acid ligase